MREILFRGKNKITKEKEWVKGDLFHHDKQLFIWAENCVTEVIPETVGQYMGIKDVDGTKIFEGDIVEETITSQYCGMIAWFNDLGWCVECKGGHLYTQISKESLKVIGNIYDNPELLKEVYT